MSMATAVAALEQAEAEGRTGLDSLVGQAKACLSQYCSGQAKQHDKEVDTGELWRGLARLEAAAAVREKIDRSVMEAEGGKGAEKEKMWGGEEESEEEWEGEEDADLDEEEWELEDEDTDEWEEDWEHEVSCFLCACVLMPAA